MEKDKSTRISKKNGLRTEISINLSWHANITSIDLSARDIDYLDDKVQLPANLMELNLSYNNFHEVPVVVSKLQKLKKLDISHNAIEYFDETPSFCHTLEQLDISTNSLHGPPYWIWTEKPKNLNLVNLSCNTNITESFANYNFEKLLQCKTLLLYVDLYNCGFKTIHGELLATFSNARTINFGTADYAYHGANIVSEVPNKGLEKCSKLERLNLSNTCIHTINSSIDVLKSLRELYIPCNNINILPNEFCNLVNLETCVLSGNEIIYLPDDIYKLKSLERFCVDSNQLCMLPDKFFELPNLKALDLYNNKLYDVLEDFSHLQEFDLAQNYMDEPHTVDYLEMKEKLRLLHENRRDGRKPEEPEEEYSPNESIDEEYDNVIFNEEIPAQESADAENDQSRCSSSPEDWDSDAHWIPHHMNPLPNASQGWIKFIEQKMQEGNFCPADAHVVSISEQVIYERKLRPQVEDECVGQFDDYSSDDS